MADNTSGDDQKNRTGLSTVLSGYNLEFVDEKDRSNVAKHLKMGNVDPAQLQYFKKTYKDYKVVPTATQSLAPPEVTPTTTTEPPPPPEDTYSSWDSSLVKPIYNIANSFWGSPEMRGHVQKKIINRKNGKR
jgi:hypothetical protein